MAYPVILLSSWILRSILEYVEVRSHYANETAVKNFLSYRGPNDCSIKQTPLARILAFVETTPDNELIAIVNDSTHKIAVLFTHEAIQRFEVCYGQRLTFKSVHSLVILRKASLKFINCRTHTKFLRTLGKLPDYALKGCSLMYLEVSEVTFFLRDQHSVPASLEKSLDFVYIDADYIARFLAGKSQKFVTASASAPATDVENECFFTSFNDGMISEDEDDDAPILTGGLAITSFSSSNIAYSG